MAKLPVRINYLMVFFESKGKGLTTKASSYGTLRSIKCLSYDYFLMAEIWRLDES